MGSVFEKFINETEINFPFYTRQSIRELSAIYPRAYSALLYLKHKGEQKMCNLVVMLEAIDTDRIKYEKDIYEDMNEGLTPMNYIMYLIDSSFINYNRDKNSVCLDREDVISAIEENLFEECLKPLD